MITLVLVLFGICSCLASSFIQQQQSDQKPIFHLTAADGHWINDPNGPFYDHVHQEYHLFAQYNPYSSVWGNMSWIHWVSKDLVTWKLLPVALYNDQDYDIGGAFSGSAILIDSDQKTIPMLIYTCVDKDDQERQCIATASNSSDPEFVSWTKSSQNPIIDFTSLPNQYNSLNFRDPAIWPKSTDSKGKDGYWVAMAAELNQTGFVVLYDCSFNYDPNNSDFKGDCKYFSQLWQSSAANYPTYMVECPDLYPLPGNGVTENLHVLKYSVMEDRRELYEIGIYDETMGKFIKDVASHNFADLEYDYGPNNHYYASKTFAVTTTGNQHGKEIRILWGWSPESDANDNTPQQKNWSGAMALPREVTYSNIWKVLMFNPLNELASLRKTSSHYKAEMNNLIINGHDNSPFGEYTIPLPVKSSMTLEVRAVFHIDLSVVDEPSDCGIEVGFLGRTNLPTPDTYEKVVKGTPTTFTKHAVVIKHQNRNVSMFSLVDMTKSGGSTISGVMMKLLPGDLNAWLESKGNHNNDLNKDSYGIDVDLVIYYDHSIVEMYAMEGVSAATARIYPEDVNIGLSAYVKTCDNKNQRVVLHSVDAWEMNSIW
jgi:beta-fructofuranosidase